MAQRTRPDLKAQVSGGGVASVESQHDQIDSFALRTEVEALDAGEPTGPAGGELSGDYPNPSLRGLFGANQVVEYPRLTIDIFGRVIAAESLTAPGAGGPSSASAITVVSPLTGASVQVELEAIYTLIADLQNNGGNGENTALNTTVLDNDNNYPGVTNNVEAVLAFIANTLAEGVTPIGPAGGVLRGNYPNPTLEVITSIVPNTYQRATISVDQYGRIVGIAANAPGGGDGGTSQRAGDVPTDSPLTGPSVQDELESIREDIGGSNVPVRRSLTGRSGSFVPVSGLQDNPRWVMVFRNGLELSDDQFTIPGGGGQINFTPDLQDERVSIHFIN